MVAFKSRFWAAFDVPRLADWPDGVGRSSVKTDAPYTDAKLRDETEADDGATSSACAEAAEPHAAALSPIRHASEAATDLTEGGRDDAAPDPRARTARERKAEPDTPIPDAAEPDASEPDTPEPEAVRPSAPDVFPDWIPSPTAL